MRLPDRLNTGIGEWIAAIQGLSAAGLAALGPYKGPEDIQRAKERALFEQNVKPGFQQIDIPSTMYAGETSTFWRDPATGALWNYAGTPHRPTDAEEQAMYAQINEGGHHVLGENLEASPRTAAEEQRITALGPLSPEEQTALAERPRETLRDLEAARGEAGPPPPIGAPLSAPAPGAGLTPTSFTFTPDITTTPREDLARQIAEQRTTGLLSALSAEETAGIPGVKRQAFIPAGRREFGLSGMAKRDVREALGRHKTKFESRRQKIKAQGLTDAFRELELKEPTLYMGS